MNRFVVAWMVVDLRSLGFAVLAAAFMAATGVLLFDRTGSWHLRFTAFTALLILFIVLIIGVANLFLGAPVISLRTTFPLP